jgi:hypothetical protein
MTLLLFTAILRRREHNKDWNKIRGRGRDLK